MKPENLKLIPEKAAVWFLGQAGYLVQSSGVCVALDPYLTNSVGITRPEFGRLFPAPMEPEDLRVDIYLVTHDHQDHLDPETISRYHYRETTRFVAPRFAARRLVSLGVPSKNVVRLDAGEEWSYPGVTVRGVFALPTSADVLDTTGYLLTFDNGRTVYHTSDTGFTAVLLKAVPKAVDVLMVPINGKWGNLTIEQALELTVVVKPRYVMPNHCDLMALNAENPETFRWFCAERRLDVECVTPNFKKPFLWS